MADFGQNQLWPKPTLSKLTSAKPSSTCGVVFVCLCVFVCCGVGVGWFHGVGFHVWVLVSKFCPSGDGPSGDRPSGDRPKFHSFFSLSRRKIRSFLFSLWVFSWNFSGGFCEDRDPHMCAFGLSGCRVKPRRLLGRKRLLPAESRLREFPAFHVWLLPLPCLLLGWLQGEV